MHLMYTRLACQAFCIAELPTCMPNSFIHNLLAASQQTKETRGLHEGTSFFRPPLVSGSKLWGVSELRGSHLIIFKKISKMSVRALAVDTRSQGYCVAYTHTQIPNVSFRDVGSQADAKFEFKLYSDSPNCSVVWQTKGLETSFWWHTLTWSYSDKPIWVGHILW